MAAKKRSSRWWKKRCDEWEAVRDSVTAREFSETWGINPQTFSWWRHEFRCRERARDASLVPVEVVETRPSEPVTMEATERWLEAELPDGIKFRFTEGTKADYVAQLVCRVHRGG